MRARRDRPLMVSVDGGRTWEDVLVSSEPAKFEPIEMTILFREV